MTLSGKIALVTGASRGIGQAIALDLARQGATVMGTATTKLGVDKISALFTDQGLKGQGILLDVNDQSSIDSAIASIQASYGVITILVNNAAITCDDIMLRMKAEEWEKVINTNLNSVFRMTKACLKGMIKNRLGRIISISSVVANTGNPGQANYAAAKAGMIGFSKSLAQEIGIRNITVNVVSPGFIDTDMTRQLTAEQQQVILDRIPLQRMGKPEDIAHTVSFLASPAAEYITGQTIHVNGGMFMD